MLNSAPPITFPDVKVFMGDDVTQPSDATYTNLLWQNLDTTARTGRMKDVCWADCEEVEEGKLIKDPGCLSDCFPADHCLTSLVRDFRGVCPGSYPSKYFPQLWFTSDTTCSFIEEGDLHFSASDHYRIKRGLCSAETEALLLDQENCVQTLLSQPDNILNTLNTIIWSTCSWQTWQVWTKAATTTTKPFGHYFYEHLINI